MSHENVSYNKRLENARERIRQLAAPSTNRKAILAFADFCFSEGLSTRRVLKYLSSLSHIATMVPKQFNKVARQDIEKAVNRIETSEYSEWTKHDYRVTIKKFFKWLRNTEDGYPPEVKWLRSTIRKKRLKLPEEILTQKEVQSMIVAAPTTRDKAFIAVLYESGCRIGEQLGLRMKQIEPDPHGFRITVHGKKGPRRLLLVASAPYLTDWLNQHPGRSEPEAYLWISASRTTELVSHSRVRSILNRAANLAGIRKAVNPHNFRHSRATHLAKFFTEAQLNEYFGWVQGSSMAATYVHLSGRDMDNAILKVNNIRTTEEDKDRNEFSLRPCNRCGLDNPPAHKFCSRCGTVLDEETERRLVKSSLSANRADKVMDMLIHDQEFVEMLERKIKELAHQGLS